MDNNHKIYVYYMIKYFKSPYRFVIMRHGESLWNKHSVFTGWSDIPLTQKGIYEAIKCGKILKESNIIPDKIFTSSLIRSIHSGMLVNDQLDDKIEKSTSWRLNEKHYGSLNGVKRSYLREMYGKEFTENVRDSYTMLPPLVNNVSADREHFPLYMNDYISDKLISGESKEMVFKRCLPYWNNTLFPYILSRKMPLIVTHKHTVRVLMKHLLDISDENFINYKFDDKEMLCVSINNKGKAVYTKKIMIE